MNTNSEITLHVTKVLSSSFNFHDKLLCYVVNRYFIGSIFMDVEHHCMVWSETL